MLERGVVAWIGEGRVRAVPDVAGLLLTGSTISDRWTPWVFIDPCSNSFVRLIAICRFPSIFYGLASLLNHRDPSVVKIFVLTVCL